MHYPLFTERPNRLVGSSPVYKPYHFDREAGLLKDRATTVFPKLARQWLDETLFVSSTSELHAHQAYQEIIRLGKTAIPLILAELEKEPNHWFLALRIIAGVNPVPISDAGDMQEMASAWISWGKEHGYRW